MQVFDSPSTLASKASIQGVQSTGLRWAGNTGLVVHRTSLFVRCPGMPVYQFTAETRKESVNRLLALTLITKKNRTLTLPIGVGTRRWFACKGHPASDPEAAVER
jgi:hypothetical protein